MRRLSRLIFRAPVAAVVMLAVVVTGAANWAAVRAIYQGRLQFAAGMVGPDLPVDDPVVPAVPLAEPLAP